MITANGKLYIEDIQQIIDDIEKGIVYSVVDVFSHYIDIASLPSVHDDEKE